MFRFLLIVGVIAGLCSTASAEMLRSDLPLWSEPGKEPWPKDCTYGHAASHCSNMQMGYWRQTDRACVRNNPGEAACFSWLDIHIAGRIQGGYLIAEANGEKGLADATPDFGAVVELGKTPAGVRLFAMQVGFRGGSTYRILSSIPGSKDSATKRRYVLDAHCEDGGSWRGVDTGTGSIFDSRYCVVSSREALIKIALAAADREPLADLEWMHPSPEE